MGTQQQKPKSKKIVCFRTHSIAKCHQPSQNPTTKTKIQKNCLLSHTFNCQMPSAISKPNNKNQNPKKLFAFAHIQLPNAISHLKTQQQKPKSKKIVCFRTHSIAKCHQPSQNPTTKTKIQ